MFEFGKEFVLLLVRHPFWYNIIYQVVAMSANHGLFSVLISIRVSPGKLSSTSLSSLDSSFSIWDKWTERMIFDIDSAMKHSYSNDDTCFSINVINEILEEDFDALLDEGSKIHHYIEGILEKEIFSKFDEFMAITAYEISKSESDTEEPPFYKITINTNYKSKISLEEPLTDLELKPFPDNLEYVFMEEPFFLPMVISSKLSTQNKSKLVSVLKKHKETFAWKMTYIPSICPSFCKHKIQLLDDKKPVFQKQRRLIQTCKKFLRKKSLNSYVSPIYCVPKKGGITVVTNKNDELVPIRTVTGWRRFVFMLRKGTDFSKESIEKSWGKELANESGSKFIPHFNSSFVEFL
nr:DNA-directed DNA polymerase [Tanacetum cinerariifolium]